MKTHSQSTPNPHQHCSAAQLSIVSLSIVLSVPRLLAHRGKGGPDPAHFHQSRSAHASHGCHAPTTAPIMHCPCWDHGHAQTPRSTPIILLSTSYIPLHMTPTKAAQCSTTDAPIILHKGYLLVAPSCHHQQWWHGSGHADWTGVIYTIVQSKKAQSTSLNIPTWRT